MSRRSVRNPGLQVLVAKRLVPVKRQQDHREATRFAPTAPPEEPACGAGVVACQWFGPVDVALRRNRPSPAAESAGYPLLTKLKPHSGNYAAVFRR